MHVHPMSLCLLAGIVLAGPSAAQQNIVYYPNGTLAGGNNFFPFGPSRGVRQQQLVPGSVFNNQPVLIQDLLIPFSAPASATTLTSGEIVYGDFHIQMSVYSGGALTTSWTTNIPNPTTVYRGRLRQRWAKSAWLPIGLERP